MLKVRSFHRLQKMQPEFWDSIRYLLTDRLEGTLGEAKYLFRELTFRQGHPGAIPRCFTITPVRDQANRQLLPGRDINIRRAITGRVPLSCCRAFLMHESHFLSRYRLHLSTVTLSLNLGHSPLAILWIRNLRIMLLERIGGGYGLGAFLRLLSRAVLT